MVELGPAGATALVDDVAPDELAPRVAERVAAGGRFVMLVGSDDRALGTECFGVEAVVLEPSGALARVRTSMALDAAAYPALTPLVPAAQWDERELKDLFGIVPREHPDPRRLVLHERFPRGFHPLRKDIAADTQPPFADRTFVPFEVHGEGVHQLPVGPIHAGVIEPGHFRFSVIGERVLHLDARLFYTHRGIEKLAEGRSFANALPLVEGACGVCSVTHALAYAQAVEELAETAVPTRARWARVLLAELERLYNHVGDLGNICAGIGFHSGVARLGWLKEQLLQLNAALTGHRYLAGIVAPGGLHADLDATTLASLPVTLEPIAAELAAAVRAVIRSEGVLDRLQGTGYVSSETAAALGALGVAARAAGIDIDLRRQRPYAAYDELELAPVAAAGGDVAARFHVRAHEATDSLRIIGECLRRLPEGSVVRPLQSVPKAGAVAIAGAEGPRGTSWLWLRAGADGSIDRMHLRSGSFANWPMVAAAVPGNLVPDFPLINKSFELCYACTDR